MHRQPFINNNDSANNSSDTNLFAALSQQKQQRPGSALSNNLKATVHKAAQKLVGFYGSAFNQLMLLK